MASKQKDLRAGLEKLGLSTKEAQIYLALLERGRLSAPALMELTGVAQGSIYRVLTGLTDRGIIQVGPGYGGKYQAAPPDQALGALIRWEREALAEREQLAAGLAKDLTALAAVNAEETVHENLEVLRDSRAISDRHDKICTATRREIVGFVKGAPAINSTGGGNPTVMDALKRGVRVRALYERAALSEIENAPYLQGWLDAGEEARVFEGSLPHKLLVFDGASAIVAVAPTEDHPKISCLVIRDPMIVNGFLTLFNTFWEQSVPLRLQDLGARTRKRAAART